MLTEFIDKIQALAIAAHGQRTFAPPYGPKHNYFLLSKDGDLHPVKAEPDPRSHTAADLDTVIDFAALHKETARVWYDRTGVVCLIDDTERRDRVTLPLTLSPQVAFLLRLESVPSAPMYSQEELVLLLRTTFADCLPRHPDLVDRLRLVNFKAGSESTGIVKHGLRSIGKQAEAELLGADRLPETFALSVPVWLNAFHIVRVEVSVALEPRPAAEKFQLIALPGQLERCLHGAEVVLGELVAQSAGDAELAELPISFGRP